MANNHHRRNKKPTAAKIILIAFFSITVIPAAFVYKTLRDAGEFKKLEPHSRAGSRKYLRDSHSMYGISCIFTLSKTPLLPIALLKTSLRQECLGNHPNILKYPMITD